MLTRITKIQNIRNYHNFSCNGDFCKKNIIYALNGSGKTNLSRFLDVFKHEELKLSDFEKLKSLEAKKKGLNIDFELVFNDNEIVNINSHALPAKTKILVYNKDFLDRNISINNFSSKTHSGKIQLAIVGSNPLIIKKLNDEINILINDGKRIREDIEKVLSDKVSTLQKSTKGKTSTFSDFLQYKNLNKVYIEQFKNIDELKRAEYNFNSLKNIDEAEKTTSRFTLLNNFDELNIEELLFTSFKFEDIEKEIEKHITSLSKEWIQIGLNFHKQENMDCCPFCRQSTKAIDIIRKYVEYIESKKAKTKGRLSNLIKTFEEGIQIISNNQQMIDNGIFTKATSHIQLLGLDKSSFTKEINTNNLTTDIDFIIKSISTKSENLEFQFKELEQKEIETAIKRFYENLKALNNIYLSNNKTIDTINTKISDTGNRKSELRKQIAQWYLIDYFNTSTEILNQVESIRKKYNETKAKVSEESAKSPQKEKKELIIKLLNKILIVAGLNKYSVDADFHLLLNTIGNSNFDISLDTKIVSDGEKTVIAFAYYIASIIQEIEKIEDLENITLLIDDPISSTSYNYLHGIGTVIKKLPSLFSEILESKRTESPQIIILTHNLQFYNLLATNIFKQDRDDKKKKNALFTLYTKDGSPILRIETQVKKLSEYMTALERVYRFNKGELSENIGGDLRKVLETICSFHFLQLSHENLEKIFDEPIETNLKLIADDYVHTDINNFEDPLPTNALEEASNSLLKLIEKKYNAQYVNITKNSESY